MILEVERVVVINPLPFSLNDIRACGPQEVPCGPEEGAPCGQQERWVVDTGSRRSMCNESRRPMALAAIPPHTFSLDVTMSVSQDICSHFMPVPVMTVPVVPVVPVPPVPVELIVVDTVVVR